MRQDPDVIMVGEIRDHETAGTSGASRANGPPAHSARCTRTTRSALVQRLNDLGIDNFKIAGALLGSIAQRLVADRSAPSAKNPPRPTSSSGRSMTDATRRHLRDAVFLQGPRVQEVPRHRLLRSPDPDLRDHGDDSGTRGIGREVVCRFRDSTRVGREARALIGLADVGHRAGVSRGGHDARRGLLQAFELTEPPCDPLKQKEARPRSLPCDRRATRPEEGRSRRRRNEVFATRQGARYEAVQRRSEVSLHPAQPRNASQATACRLPKAVGAIAQEGAFARKASRSTLLKASERRIESGDSIQPRTIPTTTGRSIKVTVSQIRVGERAGALA